MGNIFSPEFTGEKLRAVIEFVVPSRQHVVGEAVLNMERTVSNFDQANSITPVSPEPVKYVAIEKAKKPEGIEAKQNIAKSNQTRRASVKTPDTNLNTSTARANLSAIYSSIDTGVQQ
ncbi:hypothetical protein HZB74_02150 [Candidatus Saccharibacteria bacterium]|nr:hypothetical protein [Candidatus Saccharibacteria bacterium]